MPDFVIVRLSGIEQQLICLLSDHEYLYISHNYLAIA